MMKIKPIVTALSIAIVSASAIAATTDSTRTLPVRTADSLAKKVSLDVQENRSNSLGSGSSADSMTQLIDSKKDTESAAADNMSAVELTRKDEQADRNDDITEGQAVAAPSDISSIDSSDPLSFELPESEKRQDFSNDPTIKNIESKNGKRYTTLNLSNYAKQVNESVWSPNMKVNSAMTIKMQALLDWNHASPGPIDGGWGMNSKKALTNFQKMKGLSATGKMDQKTWNALIKDIPANKPVLVTYTLTQEDLNTNFATTPSGSEAKSKMKGLYYQDIKEMLGERFHMDVRYLDKLNKNKTYKVGETITVLNTRGELNQRINRIVANKADKTLYAYNGDKLVATYPTTVGSDATPSPKGTFKIINKVKMPWYKSTVGKGAQKKVHMIAPGPNNPVGVVWMGLSKPSYGLHGSPVPEGISRQGSAGCVRLTNWDVLEVYANVENGATVELK
ncbi:MAG: L,D-transpeptidase family protein [Psychrobacter sp.]|uniref:L,D-transpeptidase family protein n=1 Tax=unclassified Psychrobacter TaxID=196806 RepID=UPI00178870BA|nr:MULTISPECIES: L,D-transpeptidase family protein [unclassified Psychrobacter]MBE0442052.1 murein L,D-transpeptidase [Psychrobacter sp. FME13]